MNKLKLLDPLNLYNSSWFDLLDASQEFRRYLHQHPETKWEEEETSKLIRRVLDQYSIKWRECAKFGTIATLGENLPGEHIALRGDIDALPMTEKSGVEWSSKMTGKMHACGHDGHTATLMMSLLWIKKNEKKLKSPVSFFFQPAEEGGHGAHEMIKDGALNNIDKIYGWHNWPALSFGKAACEAGSIMSANGTFEILVKGLGGHSSQPEKCKDPVLAGSAIVVNLNQIISKRLPPQSAAVVSLTSFDAPSFETIIPDVARLKGSIRISQTKMRDEVFKMIK
jgi:hippurate hydrolase